MILIRELLDGVSRLFHRLSTAFLYLAAGTLDFRDVRAGIEHIWNDFNQGATEIDAGLLPWESDAVNRFVHPDDRIAIVGCGTGRDVIALARLGHHVVGVDPAARAVMRLRQVLAERTLPVTVVDGYFEDAPIPGAFDVIWFSNFTYTYIPGCLRRVEVLRKAGHHLAPGGRILVTLPTPAPGRPHRLYEQLARLMGVLCRSDWRLEPGDTVARQPTAARPLYHYEHCFIPGEINDEGVATGLRVLECGGPIKWSDAVVVVFDRPTTD